MSAAAPQDGPSGAAAFPWDEAMAIGLGRLGLSPKDFWAMTPREFCAAIAPLRASLGAPPTRTALDDLMRRFPDGRN